MFDVCCIFSQPEPEHIILKKSIIFGKAQDAILRPHVLDYGIAAHEGHGPDNAERLWPIWSYWQPNDEYADALVTSSELAAAIKDCIIQVCLLSRLYILSSQLIGPSLVIPSTT